MTKPKNICAGCGVRFDPVRAGQVYCCPACRGRHHAKAHRARKRSGVDPKPRPAVKLADPDRLAAARAAVEAARLKAAASRLAAQP